MSCPVAGPFTAARQAANRSGRPYAGITTATSPPTARGTATGWMKPRSISRSTAARSAGPEGTSPAVPADAADRRDHAPTLTAAPRATASRPGSGGRPATTRVVDRGPHGYPAAGRRCRARRAGSHPSSCTVRSARSLGHVRPGTHSGVQSVPAVVRMRERTGRVRRSHRPAEPTPSAGHASAPSAPRCTTRSPEPGSGRFPRAVDLARSAPLRPCPLRGVRSARAGQTAVIHLQSRWRSGRTDVASDAGTGRPKPPGPDPAVCDLFS
jgi:hypothetical protein